MIACCSNHQVNATSGISIPTAVVSKETAWPPDNNMRDLIALAGPIHARAMENKLNAVAFWVTLSQCYALGTLRANRWAEWHLHTARSWFMWLLNIFDEFLGLAQLKGELLKL